MSAQPVRCPHCGEHYTQPTPDIGRNGSQQADIRDAVRAAERGLPPVSPFKPSIPGLVGLAIENGLLDAERPRQQAAEADDSPDTLTDDRVVTDALTCHCGRPAGADGHCTAHRREQAGNVIGNHGGRL